MRTLLICAALLASPSFAGEVYKCKGPKGEITFTNIKCPDNAAAQHYGSFEPTRDDPRASLAIAHDIEQKHEDEDRQAEMAATQQASMGYSQRDAASDAASAATHDSRSAVGRDAVAAEHAAAASAEYRSSVKRWGTRMAGPPPANYGPAKPHAPAVAYDAPAAPKPPVTTTSCAENSGSVHCFRSDGSTQSGHVGPTGNGRVFGADGSSEAIRRDPAGHTKVGNTCVKDIYGQCQ